MTSNLDENGESHDENDASRSFLFEMKILAGIGCLLILLYSLQFLTTGQSLRILGVATLVAGAALLSGYMLGFIFAIPRVGDHKARVAVVEPQAAHASDTVIHPDSVPFNANLVEISDWLTKIIVGVGLVELHSIPARLGKLSYYLAPGLQPAPCTAGASCSDPLISGQAAGLAILVFYVTLGFLLGYVWTMIYFQRDLKRENTRLKQQKKTLKHLEQDATLRWKAEVALNANQLDKAMAAVDEALKNDPHNDLALMTKARVLKRQAVKSAPPDRDKLKQAISFVDQAIALNPERGEPVYNKACYQALLGQTGLKDDVLENLRAAFRLNPDLRQIAKDEEDLVSLKQDADFVRLVGQDETPAA